MNQRYTLAELQREYILGLFKDVVELSAADEYCRGIDLNQPISI